MTKIDLEKTNERVRKALGRTLRSYRLAAGMTESALVKAADLSNASEVKAYEAGVRGPKSETLVRMLKAMGRDSLEL